MTSKKRLSREEQARTGPVSLADAAQGDDVSLPLALEPVTDPSKTPLQVFMGHFWQRTNARSKMGTLMRMEWGKFKRLKDYEDFHAQLVSRRGMGRRAR